MKTALTRVTKSNAKEKAVLSSAARLFRQQGFQATSLRDIAKTAGVLLGSIYYRYPTKEDILITLMERAITSLTQAIREEIEPISDPVEKLRLGLRAHLRTLLSGDDAVFILLHEWRTLAGNPRRRMISLRDQYEQFWMELLEAASNTGIIREGVDLKLVRLFGFGAVNSVAQWYSSSNVRAPEQLADAFWAFLAFGLIDETKRPAGLNETFHLLSARSPEARVAVTKRRTKK